MSDEQEETVEVTDSVQPQPESTEPEAATVVADATVTDANVDEEPKPDESIVQEKEEEAVEVQEEAAIVADESSAVVPEADAVAEAEPATAETVPEAEAAVTDPVQTTSGDNEEATVVAEQEQPVEEATAGVATDDTAAAVEAGTADDNIKETTVVDDNTVEAAAVDESAQQPVAESNPVEDQTAVVTQTEPANEENNTINDTKDPDSIPEPDTNQTVEEPPTTAPEAEAAAVEEEEVPKVSTDDTVLIEETGGETGPIVEETMIVDKDIDDQNPLPDEQIPEEVEVKIGEDGAIDTTVVNDNIDLENDNNIKTSQTENDLNANDSTNDKELQDITQTAESESKEQIQQPETSAAVDDPPPSKPAKSDSKASIKSSSKDSIQQTKGQSQSKGSTGSASSKTTAGTGNNKTTSKGSTTTVEKKVTSKPISTVSTTAAPKPVTTTTSQSQTAKNTGSKQSSQQANSQSQSQTTNTNTNTVSKDSDPGDPNQKPVPGSTTATGHTRSNPSIQRMKSPQSPMNHNLNVNNQQSNSPNNQTTVRRDASKDLHILPFRTGLTCDAANVPKYHNKELYSSVQQRVGSKQLQLQQLSAQLGPPNLSTGSKCLKSMAQDRVNEMAANNNFDDSMASPISSNGNNCNNNMSIQSFNENFSSHTNNSAGGPSGNNNLNNNSLAKTGQLSSSPGSLIPRDKIIKAFLSIEDDVENVLQLDLLVPELPDWLSQLLFETESVYGKNLHSEFKAKLDLGIKKYEDNRDLLIGLSKKMLPCWELKDILIRINRFIPPLDSSFNKGNTNSNQTQSLLKYDLRGLVRHFRNRFPPQQLMPFSFFFGYTKYLVARTWLLEQLGSHVPITDTTKDNVADAVASLLPPVKSGNKTSTHKTSKSLTLSSSQSQSQGTLTTVNAGPQGSSQQQLKQQISTINGASIIQSPLRTGGGSPMQRAIYYDQNSSDQYYPEDFVAPSSKPQSTMYTEGIKFPSWSGGVGGGSQSTLKDSSIESVSGQSESALVSQLKNELSYVHAQLADERLKDTLKHKLPRVKPGLNFNFGLKLNTDIAPNSYSKPDPLDAYIKHQDAYENIESKTAQSSEGMKKLYHSISSESYRQANPESSNIGGGGGGGQQGQSGGGSGGAFVTSLPNAEDFYNVALDKYSRHDLIMECRRLRLDMEFFRERCVGGDRTKMLASRNNLVMQVAGLEKTVSLLENKIKHYEIEYGPLLNNNSSTSIQINGGSVGQGLPESGEVGNTSIIHESSMEEPSMLISHSGTINENKGSAANVNMSNNMSLESQIGASGHFNKNHANSMINSLNRSPLTRFEILGITPTAQSLLKETSEMLVREKRQRKILEGWLSDEKNKNESLRHEAKLHKIEMGKLRHSLKNVQKND